MPYAKTPAPQSSTSLPCGLVLRNGKRFDFSKIPLCGKLCHRTVGQARPPDSRRTLEYLPARLHSGGSALELIVVARQPAVSGCEPSALFGHRRGTRASPLGSPSSIAYSEPMVTPR